MTWPDLWSNSQRAGTSRPFLLPPERPQEGHFSSPLSITGKARKAATEAAEATGEALEAFVERAVVTQAERGRKSLRLGVNPAEKAGDYSPAFCLDRLRPLFLWRVSDFCNHPLWSFDGTREDSILDTGGNFFGGVKAVNIMLGAFYGFPPYAEFICNYFRSSFCTRNNVLILGTLFLCVLVPFWSTNAHLLCLVRLANQHRPLLVCDVSAPQLVPAHPDDSGPLVREIHLLNEAGE